MASLNYVNNSRDVATVKDRFGIDPLLDRSLTSVVKAQTFSIYEVCQPDTARPDLISYKVYGNPNYWWVILLYNGISSYMDIQQGLTLKIPSISEVTQSFTAILAQPETVNRVVEI